VHAADNFEIYLVKDSQRTFAKNTICQISQAYDEKLLKKLMPY